MDRNVFEDTREEKEAMALQMYSEKKTYREICKEVHLSPSMLKSIIDAEFGSGEGKKKGKIIELSPYAQALKFFLRKNRPVVCESIPKSISTHFGN